MERLSDGDFVIAPISNNYVTKGKGYKVSKVELIEVDSEDKFGSFGFNIIDDRGKEMYCLQKCCAVIDNNNWF